MFVSMIKCSLKHISKCSRCKKQTKFQEKNVFVVLIDFSLTVKTVTLIFISGRGSAISSLKGREIRFYL